MPLFPRIPVLLLVGNFFDTFPFPLVLILGLLCVKPLLGDPFLPIFMFFLIFLLCALLLSPASLAVRREKDSSARLLFSSFSVPTAKLIRSTTPKIKINSLFIFGRFEYPV